MQDRMGFLWVALLTMAVPATASAQHVWFSPKIGESGGYGLKIASDTWPDSSLEYTDKTYQFFKAYQISKNNKMGAYDYYYRLKLNTPTNFTATAADCKASPFLQSLLTSFFGIGKAGLILVNSTVSYEPVTGQNTSLITNSAPTLMFSQGATAGTLTPGNGCYLKETIGVEFPVIRFENGDPSSGKEVFHVNFDVSTGKELQSNAVNNALSLFSTASAAFAWTSIAAGKSSLLQKGAQAFDSAVSSAGTYNSQSPVNLTLAQQGIIFLALPGLSKSHMLEMFPYKSASIILAPNTNLSPTTVLDSTDLAFRSCTLTAIAAGTCTAKPARIGIITGDFMGRVQLPSGYQLPLSIFDPDTHPELVYDLCGALRGQLDEGLRLSTIDQMLVRWAFTKQSTLQDALLDAVKSKKILDATTKVHPNVTSVAAIQGVCWNTGDAAALAYVTDRSRLNIQLQDH